MRHIFIVGFAHSGTSLLLAMLGAHSQLYALKNESNIFLHNTHTAQQITAYFEAFYRQAALLGKTAIVEKTPRHMPHVPLMEAVYPDAKIIFTIRNSLDIIASYRRRFQDISRAVQRYAEQVLAFFENFSANKHFLFRYETLVTSPEDTLKALCAWLDIPYENAMLEYHTNHDNWFGTTALKKTSGILGEHEDYRNWQLHQPLFNGVNSYHKWLTQEECLFLQTEGGTLFSVLEQFTMCGIPAQGRRMQYAVDTARHLQKIYKP